MMGTHWSPQQCHAINFDQMQLNFLHRAVCNYCRAVCASSAIVRIRVFKSLHWYKIVHIRAVQLRKGKSLIMGATGKQPSFLSDWPGNKKLANFQLIPSLKYCGKNLANFQLIPDIKYCGKKHKRTLTSHVAPDCCQ